MTGRDAGRYLGLETGDVMVGDRVTLTAELERILDRFAMQSIRINILGPSHGRRRQERAED